MTDSTLWANCSTLSTTRSLLDDQSGGGRSCLSGLALSLLRAHRLPLRHWSFASQEPDKKFEGFSATARSSVKSAFAYDKNPQDLVL